MSMATVMHAWLDHEAWMKGYPGNDDSLRALTCDPTTPAEDLWAAWVVDTHQSCSIRKEVAGNPNISRHLACEILHWRDIHSFLLLNPVWEWWIMENMVGWKAGDLRRATEAAEAMRRPFAGALRACYKAAKQRDPASDAKNIMVGIEGKDAFEQTVYDTFWMNSASYQVISESEMECHHLYERWDISEWGVSFPVFKAFVTHLAQTSPHSVKIVCLDIKRNMLDVACKDKVKSRLRLWAAQHGEGVER